ncbi:MAG: ferrous iron transport protein A [Oscillospiraceae bacterium]|nr:ferrous iron transport protein A [Oscillospiraceae bacterium]
MPLAMMEPGKTVVIRKVTGRDEIRQRLAELGFVVNGVVTVVSRLGGSLILQVRESRVALDRELTMRIMVECIEE